MKRILIVDDDYSLRTILLDSFKAEGYDVEIAKDGETALKTLQSAEFDLIISDLMMPGISGIELMEVVKKEYPRTGFLVITAYGTVEFAVEALQKGAYDFITKPFSLSNIASRVQRFFEYEGLVEENQQLKRKLSYETKFSHLIGNSAGMKKVFQQIDIVANSDASVFIQGESGTGKELVAQAIHQNSERVDRPFLKVNCSAIPEQLFESTLFGHEKGSFTGAMRQHAGLFEEASEGTLLLDEISEMPLAMQAKLLRVLQEGVLMRVGSTKEIKVNVRVLATSNRNIKELIDQEKFRQDLYFRLNVFPISVPPLRSRPDDIPLLINHFLDKFRPKYHYDQKEVTPAAMKALINRHFEGNVRQLENLVERAILTSRDQQELSEEHFALDLEAAAPADAQFTTGQMSLAEMEKRMIHSTLEATAGNRTKAADILGISVRTLRNKLHQYEMETEEN